MGKMQLDDFLRYAKEQFGCDITVKKSEKPDTFVGIFGGSFINNALTIIEAEAKSDV